MILVSLAIFAILATPTIFATLVIPVIRSFERHIINGKKIHADPRQGDRREDFERALKTPKGPRIADPESSPVVWRSLAPLTHGEEVL